MERLPRTRAIQTAALCIAFLATVPAYAQDATPSVRVNGSVASSLTLTMATLAAMPRASVTTTGNGIETKYEGVWIGDVLKKAGVSLGAALRGAALAGYVIATGSDGYQVVFSIGELDPEMTSGQYLLADSANGKPLSGENGSFRLIVPTDKRGARSVRMLTGLEVVMLRK